MFFISKRVPIHVSLIVHSSRLRLIRPLPPPFLHREMTHLLENLRILWGFWYWFRWSGVVNLSLGAFSPPGDTSPPSPSDVGRARLCPHSGTHPHLSKRSACEGEIGLRRCELFSALSFTGNFSSVCSLRSRAVPDRCAWRSASGRFQKTKQNGIASIDKTH